MKKLESLPEVTQLVSGITSALIYISGGPGVGGGAGTFLATPHSCLSLHWGAPHQLPQCLERETGFLFLPIGRCLSKLRTKACHCPPRGGPREREREREGPSSMPGCVWGVIPEGRVWIFVSP